MRKTFLQAGQATKQIVMFISFCCLVLSTGCATVMTGKYQSIPVTSEPPGAKVQAETGEAITTPGEFHLIRNKEHVLVAEHPSYETQQLKLHNKAQGWVWGNILLGGVIGFVVDVVSGASDELLPKEVHFDFVNPQMTTREAVKAEKSPAQKTDKTPEPTSYKKQAQAKTNVPINNNPQVLYCENCGRVINTYERGYEYKSRILCLGCYTKLKNQQ